MNAPTHVPRARSGVRVRLLLGVVFAVILAAATAALPGTAKAATAICSNQTGTNGGYYYQMWSAGQGSACVTLNSGNSYSTTWSGIGDFVAGVGWNPGSSSSDDLLRQPQRVGRHVAGVALRLVHQPAR